MGHAALTSPLRALLVVVMCLSPLAAAAQGDAAVDVGAALDACRTRLIAHAPEAAGCYRALADDARTPPEDAAVAAALADVAVDLSRPAVEAAAPPTGEPVSVSALVKSGAPELVLSSAAYGGVAGFLAAATALSATRISEVDSLPWLVGAPSFGILAGGAAASAAAYSLDLDAGDAALVSSTPWIGTGWGFGLQLLLFDQRDDVGHIPWRFATVLGSDLAVGGLGAAAAWGLEVDPGDVGLMNSAALWGPALALLTWATLVTGNVLPTPAESPDAFSTAVTTALVTSALPWTAALALHPFVHVERPATWLIEAGGLTGVLSGLGLMMFFSTAGLPDVAYPAMLTTTTALGVAGGATLTFLVSDAVASLDVATLTEPLFSLTPGLLPPSPGQVHAAPGLFAVGRF